MLNNKNNTYAKNEVTRWPIPNYWDAIAIALVLAIIVAMGWASKAMFGHFQPGEQITIHLSPWYLPYYALRTVMRMFIALFCSLLFTFIFGTWAAKSRRAERIIIPMIDVLQSLPVLGYLTIFATVFVALFRGSLFGPECAAIFAIFTAQVWNITLSFYQSLKTLPHDLQEAADMFQLSAWQRFWKIEVPYATPGLLWNAMMSMSGSWVFLVASESISVVHNLSLPGVGSYIAQAISQANINAIIYAIITMLVVIALYDQLFFRPLIAWAEKFKAEPMDEYEPESWLLDLFQRAPFMQYLGDRTSDLIEKIVNAKPLRRKQTDKPIRSKTSKRKERGLQVTNVTILSLLTLLAVYLLGRFIFAQVGFTEVLHVIYLGFITTIRVTILIILSSIIWVPIGVLIGLNPRATQWVQPIIQFLAAFPANLLFPVVVLAIIHWHLNVEIWTSPLMIMGTQWYILFNVIAGTNAVPKNLHYAVSTLNIKGWMWWKRFMLPGIFPYYITGAITAAGGAWNISIIAEYVSWGHTTLQATGLGAYITQMYNINDFPRLTLGIIIMCLYVLALNHFMWRPLYNMAEERFQIQA